MSVAQPPDRASPKASDVVIAALIGGVAGAALAAGSSRLGVALSTIGGATLLAVAKAVARARRRGIENQALWYRILATGALVAPLGWLVGKTISARPLHIGIATGLLAGLLGLETSDHPIERIAVRVGFGSPSAFRDRFRRITGVSPRIYRRNFRVSGCRRTR